MVASSALMGTGSNVDWKDWGIVGALLTALAGLLTSLANRRKIDAEALQIRASAKRESAGAADQLTDTAIQLLEPLKRELAAEREARQVLQAKVDFLQTEVQSSRQENAELRYGVGRLVHQIRALGHEPVYDPAAQEPKSPA